MAAALIGGIVSSKLLPGSSIYVYDPSTASLDNLKSKYGIVPVKSNTELVQKSDIVFIAVKPGLAPVVLKDVSPVVQTSRHLFISICAGITIDALAGSLPAATKIVRVMPNTPSLVGKGASGFAVGTF